MWQDFVIGLAAGIISGILSSVIVSFWISKREKYKSVYNYWLDFLVTVMEKNDVYLPSEQLRMISEVDYMGSRWYEAITNILNIINPYPDKERVFSQEEASLAENVLIAIEELTKWAHKKHIS